MITLSVAEDDNLTTAVNCPTCSVVCDGVTDECGVCNGPGIPAGFCDCKGHVEDCLG